jgi:hypothetical protein
VTLQLTSLPNSMIGWLVGWVKTSLYMWSMLMSCVSVSTQYNNKLLVCQLVFMLSKFYVVCTVLAKQHVYYSFVKRPKIADVKRRLEIAVSSFNAALTQLDH